MASDEISSTRQLKAKHLLWNKPTGRLAKHPSLRLAYFSERQPQIGRDSRETYRVKFFFLICEVGVFQFD